MPKIPGFPEKPHYNSVKAYLSELAKDIAEMVVDPEKKERFREQLKIYADFWKQWTTFDEADRQGCWEPSMGRPECIFNIFSRSYNVYAKDTEKETKQLAGAYALCALIHDGQLPRLDKINTDIIPVEAVEETLSTPRNTLEGRLVGNWNSGPDVGEIYVIDEFFNMVNVDLKELCKSEKNKLTQASIEKQIHQANELSDIKFLELTAKKFEERAMKVLSKDETWHDLDRSLKGWFDSAISRLEKLGFKNKTSLLKYCYKLLLFYTRNANIKSFRRFPDFRIKQLASNQASELSEKFKEFAQRAKVSLKKTKAEIPMISKENEFGTIVELIQKDYLLEKEDNLKQKIAEIVQDFISRGLSNSTACVSKQLQVHFEHNNKLIDHIIESLKQDFASIPLANFKEKLITIVDEKYKKLIPFANSYLVNAGLAQRDMLSGYENAINNKKEIVKQTIETRFAISEKQDKANPTSQSDSIVGDIWSPFGIPINIKKLCNRLKHRPFWLAFCILAIVLIATSSLWWPFVDKIREENNKPEEVYNVNSQNQIGGITAGKIENVNILTDKRVEESIQPTLSLLTCNNIQGDKGNSVHVTFKPSINKTLDRLLFNVKVPHETGAKLINGKGTGGMITDKDYDISDDGKKGKFLYTFSGSIFPQIVLEVSGPCQVEITGNYISEPIFIKIPCGSE